MNDRGVAVYQHGSWSPTPAEAVGDAAADIRDGQFAINMELCIDKLHTKLTHLASFWFLYQIAEVQIIWSTNITGSLPWCLFNQTCFLCLKLAVLLWRSIVWLLLSRSAQFRPADVFVDMSWTMGMKRKNNCIFLIRLIPAEQQGELNPSDPKEFLQSKTHFKRGMTKHFCLF